jgi:hypothetical protein
MTGGTAGTLFSGTTYTGSQVLTGVGTANIGGTVITPGWTPPSAVNVWNAEHYGYSASIAGSLTLPSASQVNTANGAYGGGGNAITPTLTLPAASDVWTGTSYGVGGNGSTGTLSVTPSLMLTSGTVHGTAGTYNASNLSLSGSNVAAGVPFAYSSTGTLTSGGTMDVGYILAPHVLAGSGTGTLTLPPPKKVLSGTVYGSGGTSSTGTFLPRRGK